MANSLPNRQRTIPQTPYLEHLQGIERKKPINKLLLQKNFSIDTLLQKNLEKRRSIERRHEEDDFYDSISIQEGNNNLAEAFGKNRSIRGSDLFEMNIQKKIKLPDVIATLESQRSAATSKLSYLSRNSVTEICINTVEEFLKEFALSRFGQEEEEVNATDLLTNFDLWLKKENQIAIKCECPSPKLFGRILGTFAGLKKVRRETGNFYEFDIQHWATR
jgi:hypothetical protein